MLQQVADGVRVHESEVLQSNAVVVNGDGGVLLIDAGILADELGGIADELRRGGEAVLAGFSTHPHWDHLLWHAELGTAPRFGTARCAALIEARLADAEWRGAVAGMIPVDIVDRVPLDDTFGRVMGLPAGATVVPWGGPRVRVIEHQAHAPGHAALLIEDSGVLVAGDMLSDALIPMLNVMAPDPIGDYLDALDLIEASAAGATVIIPGHGAVGTGDELQRRIALDRAYLIALRDGRDVLDPRLGPSVKPGGSGSATCTPPSVSGSREQTDPGVSARWCAPGIRIDGSPGSGITVWPGSRAGSGREASGWRPPRDPPACWQRPSWPSSRHERPRPRRRRR